jgi:type II secretory pathway component PulF
MSEAMAKHPDIFSALYVSMVRVGETGGILDKTMQQLVNLMSREIKIRSNLIGALIYPFFILTVGLISMIVILVWVLPKIINTIGMQSSMLPLPTKMLMGQMEKVAARKGVVGQLQVEVALIWKCFKDLIRGTICTNTGCIDFQRNNDSGSTASRPGYVGQ